MGWRACGRGGARTREGVGIAALEHPGQLFVGVVAPLGVAVRSLTVVSALPT
jgi:hypothetical protein